MKFARLRIDGRSGDRPGGSFPLWNSAATLDRLVAAKQRARAADVLALHVQHVADESRGTSPFFDAGAPGVEIHPRMLASAPDAPIVVNSFADALARTTLESVLTQHGIEGLLVAGMTTQNGVTHGASSNSATRCSTAIRPDLCATVTELLHRIGLHAVSTRRPLTTSGEAF